VFRNTDTQMEQLASFRNWQVVPSLHFYLLNTWNGFTVKLMGTMDSTDVSPVLNSLSAKR